ncbi:MAG: cytidylate kinase-like family protein [Anaerolineae bacterium]|nr:cytidylate kinase-like family protein [Anaerolineae bacterium]
MVAVTVSREHGALGTEIGHRVADRLGGRYLDRELLDMAFQFAGLPVPGPAPLRPSPALEQKEMPGLARRIVDAIAGPISAGLQPWPRYVPPRPGSVGDEDSLLRQAVATDQAYVDLMSQVLERVLEHYPDSVIVGRGAQCALAGRPGVLHVHICATVADRIRRTAQAEGLSESEAADRVHALDEERAHYIRRYYAEDWQKPCLYHLTLNTSWLSVDQAVDIILYSAGALGSGQD